MSHLVRCWGGVWEISCESSKFAICDPLSSIEWGVGWNNRVRNDESGDSPAWLPIAWLCCEADPDEGPGFAAAILDAALGDDAPALIACDWLEETGAKGWGRLAAEELAEGWAEPRTMFPSRRESRFVCGPLHSWARRLLAARCVGCGGRRDGWDDIAHVLKPAEEYAPYVPALGKRAIVREVREIEQSEGGGSLIPADCPLCGFPAHPSPPPLAIPVANNQGANHG